MSNAESDPPSTPRATISVDALRVDIAHLASEIFVTRRLAVAVENLANTAPESLRDEMGSWIASDAFAEFLEETETIAAKRDLSPRNRSALVHLLILNKFADHVSKTFANRALDYSSTAAELEGMRKAKAEILEQLTRYE